MDARPFINLFNGRMRVTFINATTGKLIGVQKMKPDQLPASFNKPTFIEFNGMEWRIMKAEPVHAQEYQLEKKLTLHVEDPLNITQQFGCDYPTICEEYPLLSVTESIFNDFCLNVPKEKWRQFEFLPSSLLPPLQEEIEQIGSILFPASEANNLHGFFDIHLRKSIRQDPLNISFDLFCERMNIREKGAIRIASGEFVQNGFALRSENYTYYGTLTDNMIEELNLERFECADEEFFELATTYDLLLADWCNGKLIMV